MKWNVQSYWYSIFFIVLIFSCDQKSVKPSSSGKSGEIVIVIDSTLWKGEIGNILCDSLQADFPALPQSEPLFKIVYLHPSGFKNILQLHRNVLLVETGPVADGKNYALTFKRNVFAKPQLILNIRAINKAWLDTALHSLSGAIIDKFANEEQTRTTTAFESLPISKVSEEVKRLTAIRLPLTDDYFIAKHLDNYIWIRKETIHTTIGIQIYKTPYVSDTSFNLESIIGLRDSISKANIPGPLKGSYMKTDKTSPITSSPTTIDGSYVILLRGLWRTEGDFMGGPFLTYAIYNKKKGELVYVDAFIYAPKFNKREYVKELDALIHALRFEN